MALKVYEAKNAVEAGMVASALSSEGIPCEVRDSAMSTLIAGPWTGSIGIKATVWILNDADFERARQIVTNTDRLFAGKEQ
jgi:hypothetical protein